MQTEGRSLHVIRRPCFALEESDIPTGKYFPQ
jgi:hypothetical protein